MYDVIDLRDLGSDDLAPVLEDEVLAWRAGLQWDFTPSADLVRRFVRIQALSGCALVVGGRCIGYAYYVTEDRKALVGDLYVMREWASGDSEEVLIGAVLNAIAAAPAVSRVEAQLMMLHTPFERRLPYSRYARVHPRQLMMADLSDAARLPVAASAPGWGYAQWAEDRQDDAARVIAAAYKGHVDATINDQYRSVAGARRFLTNIVQYPGCGSFHHGASWVSVMPGSQRVCGLCLASLVAEDVGHITQICVAPEVKGMGIGYELLRRSLLSLAGAGCARTSLTVTAANTEAIKLYQRVGFHVVKRFAAYVWEGF